MDEVWLNAAIDVFNYVADNYIKCSPLFAVIEEENEVLWKQKDL